MALVAVPQFVYDDALEPLRAAGHELRVRTDDHPLPHDELVEFVAGADALLTILTDRIDEAVFAAAPSLRVVANVAAGFDNIDVDAATAAGVLVCNTPGVLAESTADLAFALLLGAARRVVEGDRALRGGEYTHWVLDQPQIGLDVHGKTLGLFGCGEIGQAVARRAAHGFAMDVCYHTRSKLDPEVERSIGARWVEFDELVEQSDFVSLHAPLTDATRHRFDADVFARMRPTSVLVNTARGPLVDESALADALADGIIAGAGIDVYENEPAVHPRLLEQHARVVLLPHIGSATTATRRRMADVAVANVVDTLAGEQPSHAVNRPVVQSN